MGQADHVWWEGVQGLSTWRVLTLNTTSRSCRAERGSEELMAAAACVFGRHWSAWASASPWPLRTALGPLESPHS